MAFLKRRSSGTSIGSGFTIHGQSKRNPIPSWRNRLQSLDGEKNEHLALKKYCDFMSQAVRFRDQLDRGAAALDAHIQQEIDRARGK